ncbi:hypothetical protein CapIbe_017819 [Capra ibex]
MERASTTIQAKDLGHFAGATYTVRDARCVRPLAPHPPCGAGTFVRGWGPQEPQDRSGRRTSVRSWTRRPDRSAPPASWPPASLPLTRCPNAPFDPRLGEVFGTIDPDGGRARKDLRDRFRLSARPAAPPGGDGEGAGPSPRRRPES